MKKVFYISIVVFALFMIIRYIKKIKDVAKLQIGIADFKFDKQLRTLADVTAWLLDIANLSIPMTFDISINNFGQSKYTINNLFIAAYTTNGIKVASPLNPLQSPVIVLPLSETIIQLKYNLTVPGLVALAKEAGQMGDTLTIIRTILTNWFTRGVLGLTLVLKGYVNAEGVKMLDIPVNETQEI